ncbi:MAG TPA: patatin-like phospholipase family protein [Candidatus Binatia bacterium]|jgi:predicted acylesterase/phospholipase RssA|nr:patatin-like phospholipase family protein [Candidatus Binatia bacterium]
MGLTIVHKSDLSTRKKNPRIALVLAGGAVTGGAYKLGGLKALDDFLVNRKTTDFDIYVGLSAGAFLAAPLAGGVTPPEMLRSLDGTSEDFTYLSPLEFYNLNLAEFARKPLEFLVDLVTYFPNAVYDFLVQTPALLRTLQEPLSRARRRPSLSNLIECARPLIDAIGSAREFPFPLAYLPSGVFDNSTIERYLRHNIERRGLTNDFRVLYRGRGVELYIVAMNLDTAERVVFGHDEDTSLTISEAVQASTALPGFYKPARIKGVDYVDGGVRRTANIDVAIEHGADLVICYNPFRPFSNRVLRRYDAQRNEYTLDGRPLADQGMIMVLNQVLRTLLHSRLQLAIRQYQDDPYFQGDIILLEPAETDLVFFKMAPLNLWASRSAGAHGYLSVTESIEAHYELIRQILQSYGVLMTRKEVREGLERLLRTGTSDAPDDVLLREVPKRNLHVA